MGQNTLGFIEDEQERLRNRFRKYVPPKQSLEEWFEEQKEICARKGHPLNPAAFPVELTDEEALEGWLIAGDGRQDSSEDKGSKDARGLKKEKGRWLHRLGGIAERAAAKGTNSKWVPHVDRYNKKPDLEDGREVRSAHAHTRQLLVLAENKMKDRDDKTFVLVTAGIDPIGKTNDELEEEVANIRRLIIHGQAIGKRVREEGWRGDPTPDKDRSEHPVCLLASDKLDPPYIHKKKEQS